MLRFTLTSVNSALSDVCLASSVDIDKVQLFRSRGQQSAAIETLLQSNLDRETNLSEVLQSLQNMSQGLTQLELDKDIREAEDMAEEWIGEKHHSIQKFMLDIEASIVRLHELYGVNKTQKMEAAVQKMGLWRWWREPEVDAKTILEIEKLHPPTLSRILQEPKLATKSTRKLSFMVGDIARSISCNRAMRLAFRFIQMGLYTLNNALQEQTLRATNVQAQLNDDDCGAKAELEASKRRIEQLEAEKAQLKEQIAAQQLKIYTLQYTVRSGSAEQTVEQVTKSPLPQSLTMTEVPPALFKYTRLPPITTNKQKSKISAKEETKPELTESIVTVPFEDQPGRAGFRNSATRSPGDILKEIQSTVFRQDRVLENVDTCVLDLLDVDSSRVSTSSSDLFVEKPIRKSQRSVLKHQLTKSAGLQEDLERYRREMMDDRILETMMAGETYMVNMESQVTNLKLLRQAAVNGQISSELHCMAKDLVTSILDMEGMRLACLVEKFRVFKSLKQVSTTLNTRLRAARELKDGREMKKMYFFLTRLDGYRKRVLEGWTAKQAELDRNRKTCLAQMLYLFNEMRKDCKVYLFAPVPRPRTPTPILTVEPCKMTRPRNTVRRCHRLPSIAQAPPLVKAREETKLPALVTKGSGERCSRHVQLGGDHGEDPGLGGEISTLAWERLGIPQSELANVAREREDVLRDSGYIVFSVTAVLLMVKTEELARHVGLCYGRCSHVAVTRY
ncbi:hypothetical protein DPEC_G00343810 [Dallia pectoralis]|uniref:Uncharacterized protein n=1 Tax=Dallia pectoralis TaxID=75939 RepID=A0ACC2F321_DALPE|nr:hypothetical protein DPEC_G00343810 [Dallia pectoralis]